VDGGFAVYTDADGERALREHFEVESCAIAGGWEESWREFHRGVAVGRFWVGPPWVEAPAGAEAIVIDPGRAFGTGAHATTRLTLELLQKLRPTSLLDVGCGSGVLAIAAVKLGFTPVIGIDIDETAVEVTLANAQVNGVQVDARRCDALRDELPETEVAVANVVLDVVEQLLPRLPAPQLVASGYLEGDEPELQGWRRIERRTTDGWAADLLKRDVT
jgi:ribosomal protein L11 methyltransferase